MLDGLEKIMQSLSKFNADVEVAEDIVASMQDIVKLVKIQLAKGIDGNGEPVYLIRKGVKSYYYAYSTIRKKDMFGVGLGSVTDHVTNFMSGAFYNSIFVNVDGNGNWNIMASDWKYDLILARSGPAILNLSPESQMFFLQEDIGPLIQAEIDAIFVE